MVPVTILFLRLDYGTPNCLRCQLGLSAKRDLSDLELNTKTHPLILLSHPDLNLGKDLPAASDRRDGGLGIAMLLPPADVGVGICRCVSLVRLAEAGAEALMSPTSEKMSPRSA